MKKLCLILLVVFGTAGAPMTALAYTANQIEQSPRNSYLLLVALYLVFLTFIAYRNAPNLGDSRAKWVLWVALTIAQIFIVLLLPSDATATLILVGLVIAAMWLPGIAFMLSGQYQNLAISKA